MADTDIISPRVARPAPDVPALRAAVAAAERAADDVLLSDDLACVTGAHDRALAAVRAARRELAEAELAEAMRDPAYQRLTRPSDARA